LDAREIDSFNKHWGWFDTMVTLAKEDITKIEQITTYPLIFVLNFLAILTDKRQLQERDRQKQQMRLNANKR
jgi:hypothetical protein